MKRRWVLCLAVPLFFGWTGVGLAQQSATSQHRKIPAEVWQKAKQEGVVRLIVQLNVPTKPEAHLDQQAVLTQRQAIAAAQDKLVDSLAGTRHRVTGRLRSIPFIGLEVGVDALVVLERSPLVLGVEPDRTFAPQK